MTGILSLPILKEAVDCADFGLTVKPYVPQLLSLPNQLYSIASSSSKLQDLSALYLNTNPLITAFAISLFLGPIFLILSEINKNYSQVDRAWSILPTVYIVHYTAWAHKNGIPAQRLDNVLVFAAIWSVRLTYNFWRKGGYSMGGEDYRWAIIKDYVGPTGMFIFNVTFISLGQSILLFLITTPAYILMVVSRADSGTMTLPDIIFSRVLMGLVLIEFFADQQQWNYQQAKKRYQATAKLPADSKYSAEDLDRGFVVSGLWSWSRHPNFAAEQAIWVVLYQWACYASDSLFNWTLTGAMGYLLLFQGSTWFTERISAGKYPEYKEYQRLVGRFIPKWLPRGGSVSEELSIADKPKDSRRKSGVKKS